MEQSSSCDYDEQTVMHQFDRKCKLALDGEVADYEKHMAYLQKHEIMFSELLEKETDCFFTTDEYGLEKYYFKVGGYDVEVKDALLAEALETLTERKRDVILLSYFMEMSDADIARQLHLVRSTVHEHRTRSLELLKNKMEERVDENSKKKRQ
ncbi:sigma-70 family RNA polymerase sigma factor [Blautia producta]|uniref:RNA polymerase sigma factor n=1 Tax=Enterocloster clostridioformis TaxID=1531 RepID=UPI0015709162|nr:sigma-70 family RNA polymerase sigma factor [Enterocloster clostridioformis]NSG11499.1 sigma-70 family RNA polymerase sigma factor [Blautia producta]NSG15001.1 sigma-70 family RNA polymerase sigma factor [Blautia producta]NSJ75193.1 sigma-70 family RNA polymerase sigma factor [Blautia producta]